MLKITRFTDYALVVLCCLVKDQAKVNEAQTKPNKFSANEIAKLVNLQLPTVSKVLKLLVKAGFVKSYRGVEGGYQLIVNPDEVTVDEVISAIEGPVALTACSNEKANIKKCENIIHCSMSAPWQKINVAVTKILTKITLTDITYNRINI